MVAAPILIVSVTAVGWAADASELLDPRRGQAGDLVGVTGSLGAAAAALAQMEGRAPRTPPAPAPWSGRRPPAPPGEGRTLAARGPTR